MIKIPWTKDDAPKHKKGLTEAEKKKWAEIANSVLSDCKKNGGGQKKCEEKAIRIANDKVGGKSNSGEEGMNKKKIQAPKSRFTFYSEEPLVELAGSNDGEAKTFAMTAYTGGIMPDIFGGSIAVDVSGIDFGSKKRYPILEEHDRKCKIGVANGKPNTADNQVRIDKIYPLSNDTAQEFISNLEDGFPFQSSISIAPKKIEEVPEGETSEVNGLKFKGPGIIIRSSRFKEASVCVFGRDENTKVQENSADEQEEFEVEVISSFSDDDSAEEGTAADTTKTQNYDTDGGNSMNWDEFKEQYPELAQKIESQFSEKDEQIAEKDRQIKELSESNTSLSDRLNKLEKNEALRREKELCDYATSIVDNHLKQSSIPEHLHGKVHAQLSHKGYVDQEGNFDEESFTQAVQDEVKDWDERFSQLDLGTIQGIGNTGGSGKSEDENDPDKLSDVMVGYVTSADA